MAAVKKLLVTNPDLLELYMKQKVADNPKEASLVALVHLGELLA